MSATSRAASAPSRCISPPRRSAAWSAEARVSAEQGRLDWSAFPGAPSGSRRDADGPRHQKGTRVLQGLLSLAPRSSRAGSHLTETACQTALSYGAFRAAHACRKLLASRNRRSRAANAAAVSRRASDYSALCSDYARVVRAGDPSPGRSLVHRARHLVDFYEAYLDKRMSLHACRATKRPRRGRSRQTDRGRADIPPPRPGYPLSGCVLSRAATLFPRTLFKHSSPIPLHSTRSMTAIMHDRLQTTLRQLRLSGLSQTLDDAAAEKRPAISLSRLRSSWNSSCRMNWRCAT